MPIDLGGADGGSLAAAFAAGAAATWGFIRAFISGPIAKQYEARIRLLEADNTQCRADMTDCRERIRDLEVLLTANGFGPLRQQVQKAVSEVRRDIKNLRDKP